MNIWSLIIPLGLGAIGLLQGALNRQISVQIGVAQATLITNIGTIILCVILYAVAKAAPQVVPAIFQIRAPLTTYKWWYAFPPVFGFLIVAGMPYAIANFGAVKVTVGLIAAQMIVSVLWDLFVEGIELNSFKLIGITCAMLSVIFIALAKQ